MRINKYITYPQINNDIFLFGLKGNMAFYTIGVLLTLTIAIRLYILVILIPVILFFRHLIRKVKSGEDDFLETLMFTKNLYIEDDGDTGFINKL